MRIPPYISPSSLSTFYEDRMEFYLRYMAENRPPKIPQSKPMAVGSAFDAYLKSHLAQSLFGNKPEFEFETIFESQVEAHNRDWAREHGMNVFRAYLFSGALGELIYLLHNSTVEPKIEFRLEGKIKHSTNVKDIPLLGIPDMYFTTKSGYLVILDLKVTGYCGNSRVSPPPGYIKIFDGWDHNKMPPSRNHNCPHKDAFPYHLGTGDGLVINANQTLEQIKTQWADQLSIYAWLLGAPLGSDYITMIENLVCSPGQIRVAIYSNRVGKTHQHDCYGRICQMWDTINSDHIFTDMSKEESQERCKSLDNYHEAFVDSGNVSDDWFKSVVRG